MVYDDPLSADEDVARFRLLLRHVPLSTLVAHDFLTYDSNSNVVRRGRRFDAITPVLTLVDDHYETLDDYR